MYLIQRLEADRVADVAAFVFGAVGNDEMARDGLRDAASDLVVSGRVLDTGRRTTAGLDLQPNQNRIGGRVVTGLEVLDESLHGGTDVRFSEALQEHLALGAGVSNRRRPRNHGWWDGRWGGSASAATKGDDD